jgi:hypothetical protein
MANIIGENNTTDEEQHSTPHATLHATSHSTPHATSHSTPHATSHSPYVDWTPEHENILVDWADKAVCYRWLHSKSHNNYSRLNTLFTIPVIVMSTVTGTANFAQDRVPAGYVSLFTAIVGTINLFAGILTTIQQFLKISELNESHRVSSIAWGKFSRNIKIELAKAPQERMPVIQLLKHCKDEFDRLIDTSPTLAEKVIKLFISTFSGGEIKLNEHGEAIDITPKQLAFSELNKPEICDSIETTYNIVYKSKANDDSNNSREIARIISERKTITMIEEFIVKFELEKLRHPTVEEIVNNLDSVISINTINSVIDNLRLSNQKVANTGESNV